MSSIKRVLQVNASSKYGGVSAMILNYSRNLDHEKYEIDFLSPDKSSFEIYKDEITNELNGNIYELNVKFKGIKKYILIFGKYRKFLKKHKYDIVHINSGILIYNLEMAFISKLSGVKKVIVHSHSSRNYKGLKKVIMSAFKKLIPYTSNYYLACSTEAAISMFPKKIIKEKKYIIINNAIATDNFKYDATCRKKIRDTYEITDKTFVFGHVGRFVEVKNHKFLLKVFSKILEKNNNSILMLVGDGPLLLETKKMAINMGIDKYIIFCGHQNDISKFYQMFDAFILPSLYEGLPVVSIEAQTSGLPCFLSSSISNECNLTGNVQFMPLDLDASKWAINILKKLMEYKRIDMSHFIIKNGFDIKTEVSKLDQIYQEVN